LALLAFMDANADPDRRLEGAMLVAGALDDLALIRSIAFKKPGE
jgi:hypothetical protein